MDNTNITCCKTKVTRICWSSIIAGAFVGVGLGFLLNVFGMAIGLSAYSAPTEGSAAVIAWGGIIGLVIGVIAAMCAAGFVSGYMGRFHNCYCHGGVIYGFITWSLALMLSAVLIMPMVHYVSFYKESIEPAIVSSTVLDTTMNNNSAVLNPAVKVNQNNTTQNATANLDVQPKHLAWSGYVLFLLFFIGAISSCIGACLGMRCRQDVITELK